MFKGRLNITVNGSQEYILTNPLVWQDGEYNITVKSGFVFDGASIPKALWSIIGSPMTGGYQRAGCLHDALYASQILDRKIADDIFLESMKSDGVSYFKRYSMYWAVRSFGYSAWNENKKSINKWKEFVCLEML